MANTKTPAMVLQELTVRKSLPPPEYILKFSKEGSHNNKFYYTVNVAHICAEGFGRSKQVAKHDAASNALKELEERGLYDPSSNPVQEFNAQSHRNESDSPFKDTINFIGTLKDQCIEYKLPYPLFHEVSDVGPAHYRIFTYECKMASITTQATALTKKQAKQLAAKEMLDKIKETCPELMEKCIVENNAICETDGEALRKYNELDSSLGVLVNRACGIDDFTECWKKLMIEKNIKFEDFQQEFEVRNLEGLDHICQTLEVEYKIEDFQESPCIVVAIFGLDAPFSVMANGSSQIQAKEKLLEQIYTTLELYMSN